MSKIKHFFAWVQGKTSKQIWEKRLGAIENTLTNETAIIKDSHDLFIRYEKQLHDLITEKQEEVEYMFKKINKYRNSYGTIKRSDIRKKEKLEARCDYAANLLKEIWEVRLDGLLEDIPEKQHSTYKTLIENQRKLEKMSRGGDFGAYGKSDIPFSLVPLIKRLTTKILQFRYFMGIQPMSGPVGLSYQLVYKDLEKQEIIEMTDGTNDEVERKIGLEIISRAVEAGTYKLQAGWSVAASQDLKTFHGLDIEEEITSALVEEIGAEIFAFNFDNLKRLATKKTMAKQDDPMKLAVIIHKEANDIARITRRGEGNFIIASEDIVASLASITPQSMWKEEKEYLNHMISKHGILNDNIHVFSLREDSKSASSWFMIGYKGSTDVDSGYNYCPYLPVVAMGETINPTTFEPVVSTSSRGGVIEHQGQHYYTLVTFE